jgi:serine/threonine protein kinase
MDAYELLGQVRSTNSGSNFKQHKHLSLTLVEQIGKGSFGTVSRIRRKSDGRIMVCKEITYGKMSDKEKQMLVSEVNILRELKHPNIVRYYDRSIVPSGCSCCCCPNKAHRRVINKETTKIWIIMEFCERGDLWSEIRRHRKAGTRFLEKQVWDIAFQLLLALYDCHSRPEKILHRDIKPANIFIDRNGTVKLGDFGLARVLGKESFFAHTNVGTPFYMSPEQINEKP